MLPESVLNTLVGAFIGFFSATGLLFVQGWLETRKRRRELIEAVEAAARSSTVPVMSVMGGVHYSPAEQFLPVFWRDLAVLGTYTQMMVVTYFTLLIESTRTEGGTSKEIIETLMKLQQNVLDLIEKERKGERPFPG